MESMCLRLFKRNKVFPNKKDEKSLQQEGRLQRVKLEKKPKSIQKLPPEVIDIILTFGGDEIMSLNMMQANSKLADIMERIEGTQLNNIFFHWENFIRKGKKIVDVIKRTDIPKPEENKNIVKTSTELKKIRSRDKRNFFTHIVKEEIVIDKVLNFRFPFIKKLIADAKIQSFNGRNFVRFPELETLVLVGYHPHLSSGNFLSLHSLRKLELRDQGESRLNEYMWNFMKTIEYLKLVNCLKLFSDAPKTIGHLKLPNLQILECTISDVNPLSFKMFSNLKKLICRECIITDDCLEHISGIEEMELYYTRFKKEGFQYLKNLRKLTLEGNFGLDDQFFELLSKTECSSTLTQLKIKKQRKLSKGFGINKLVIFTESCLDEIVKFPNISILHLNMDFEISPSKSLMITENMKNLQEFYVGTTKIL